MKVTFLYSVLKSIHLTPKSTLWILRTPVAAIFHLDLLDFNAKKGKIDPFLATSHKCFLVEYQLIYYFGLGKWIISWWEFGMKNELVIVSRIKFPGMFHIEIPNWLASFRTLWEVTQAQQSSVQCHQLYLMRQTKRLRYFFLIFSHFSPWKLISIIQGSK